DGQNGSGGETWDWGQNDNDGGAVSSNPYTFNVPNGNSQVRIRVRAENVDNSRYFNIDTITIEGNSLAPQPEINITGNGNTINDGDTSPVVTDDTDFGSIATGGIV